MKSPNKNSTFDISEIIRDVKEEAPDATSNEILEALNGILTDKKTDEELENIIKLRERHNIMCEAYERSKNEPCCDVKECPLYDADCKDISKCTACSHYRKPDLYEAFKRRLAEKTAEKL